MRSVQPEVYLIAETAIHYDGFQSYLGSIGASDWRTSPNITDAERLVEFAGRLCYRSFKPGLNPNVTKVREGNDEYLNNIVKQGHGSVFEHATVSFVFANVSRVFTHELVRHRVGVGISQESMRYVRNDDIPFWFPESLKGDAEISARVTGLMLSLEAFQDYARKRLALDSPESGFGYKKLMTSALRRFLPDGIATSILWTANLRTLRHVLELRTSKAAEEEIRLVFDKVGHILHARYPNVFGDFIRNVDGEWVPRHSKI
jgi:thymidylate synthase (FAD)